MTETTAITETTGTIDRARDGETCRYPCGCCGPCDMTCTECDTTCHMADPARMTHTGCGRPAARVLVLHSPAGEYRWPICEEHLAVERQDSDDGPWHD